LLDVITLGEAMIRFSPQNYERLEFATQLDFKVGGSESNVAVALARLGLSVGWISKLTDNSLGRKIESELKRWAVNLDSLIWTPNYRVGTYYAEFGSDPRPTNIIYDRKSSAFSHITVEEINWTYLEACKHFHTSGITVALSDNCETVVMQCLKFMNEKGKSTSFDLNYRSRLWTGQDARTKLSRNIFPHVDILLASESDLDKVFVELDGDFKEKALNLLEEFDLKVLVLTRGPNPPYILENNGNELLGKGYQPNIVDRIGAGDAFDAGFLYGYLSGSLEMGLEYGEAMSALKFSIPGDWLIVTQEEIEGFIKRRGSLIKR